MSPDFSWQTNDVDSGIENLSSGDSVSGQSDDSDTVDGRFCDEAGDLNLSTGEAELAGGEYGENECIRESMSICSSLASSSSFNSLTSDSKLLTLSSSDSV